ncbi:MAG: hypothetical protein NZM07_03270 [Elioraea sp.]|nr:hypothetical protein [Elioraea sp.]
MKRRRHAFARAVERAIREGRTDAISDRELREVFTAAVRLGYAKFETAGRVPPLLDAEAVSATEVVVAVSEMIRAANLNLLDVAMWFRRPLPGV